MISQATIGKRIEELEAEAHELDAKARQMAGTRDGGHGESDAAAQRRFAAQVLRELA